MVPVKLDKLEDWNTQVRQETCPQCGTKLNHRQVERQIATVGPPTAGESDWVSDMTYSAPCKRRLGALARVN